MSTAAGFVKQEGAGRAARATRSTDDSALARRPGYSTAGSGAVYCSV